MQEKYDVIGIGFGPSNIALAIQCQDQLPKLKMRFLEKNNDSIWQKEMLLRNSDIQNNPLRDLITLVNPRSKYTFINFLHSKGRLHNFLNTGLYYPMRKDYADYIDWCAKDFQPQVKYNEEVKDIEFIEDNKYLQIITSKQIYKARTIVLAPGREPYIPQEFKNLNSKNCFHLTNYLSSIKQLDPYGKYNFSVVGSSQSAVEIILDLASKFPNAKINSIIRSFSFKLKDTSPFSYEVFLPENIDFFYSLSSTNKEIMRNELRATNYSSVDKDILHELYTKIYMQKAYDEDQITLIKNAQIKQVIEGEDHTLNIHYKDKYSNLLSCISSNFIILATGFNDIGSSINKSVPILSKVIDKYKLNSNNILHINRNYSLEPIEKDLPNIYLSGLCETSHGLGDAGSFSLIPVRCAMILNSLMEKYGGINESISKYRSA